MSFKIAIGNVVLVPVKFTLREGSVDRLFSFTLTATRRSQEEIEAQPDQSVLDLLKEVTTDWQGQRLVLLDNNEPAAFSTEAFDFMLKQPGILGVVWAAYQRQCGSKEKN